MSQLQTSALVHAQPNPLNKVLEVRDVAKSFGGVHAVRGVTFDVREGEILGLIGPNGSGKSTLFNCILGQLTPNRGDVLVSGKSVAGLRPSQLNRLGIGRTFQLLQVFPELTVRENLILAGQEHEGTRFTRKGEALYVTLLGTPQARDLVIESVTAPSSATVTLLGHAAPLTYEQRGDHLAVTLPEHMAPSVAHVLKIAHCL